MIQWMLTIWSLVPLHFLNPAYASGNSLFTYCWSLAWRILSITLLACEMSAIVQFSSIQSFSHVLFFVTPWTAACQASLSITSFQSLIRLMSIESVIPSNHLILCHPLQTYPASGSFVISQFFASGGQSIGASASASVLPMNIQNWFPLGWTGLISLQSRGLSRVFSITTVQKHQFFGAQLSL